MASFIPDMIDELVQYISQGTIGTEYFFSKDNKDENYMWDISFSHIELFDSPDVSYYLITWHDDDDTERCFEHKAAFYVHELHVNRTLGGVESALLTMLGRFCCNSYVEKIMNAIDTKNETCSTMV